jgi:putative flippase GtrA
VNVAAPAALSRLPLGQFARYVVVGAVSTLCDWTLFYLFALRLHLHYQAAVALSLFITFGVHFSLNKLFTFRCPSKRIVRQFLLHLLVAGVYLALSMGCMYVLVETAGLPKMLSKMVTTGIMVTVSFTLSKFVTFNRKLTG